MNKSEEDLLNAYYKDCHESRLSDPIYAAGFKSKRNNNPYTFDRELGYELLKISLKNILTDEDKVVLISINKQLAEQPYSRWADGFYNQRRIKP